MIRSRTRTAIAAAIFGLALAGTAGAIWAASGKPPRSPEAEPAPTPPLTDPNVSSPSTLATQPPGPLVTPATSPDITIVEPNGFLGSSVEVHGTAKVPGNTVRVLIVNEQIGMIFDGEAKVTQDGSWRIDEAYFKEPSKGTRSVVRVTAPDASGKSIETNREVTQQ